MKDICRQIAFLREHDSNMLITTQIRVGGVGELAEELNDAAVYASWKKAIIFGIEEMLVMGNSISTDAYGTNRGVERGPVCASWPSMVQIGNPERSLMGLVSQVRPKPKG